MKTLKFIGVVLAVLVAVVVLLGLIAPKKVQVERALSIQAPKILVFRHVQYWRNWKAWSPWAQMDSTMKVTLEGQDGSPGSIYKWTGKQTGDGEMLNTGVQPSKKLEYRLKFIKPFPSESDGYVQVADDSGMTRVSWGYIGKTPFPLNVMNLFLNMDKLLGKDFEKGLSLLKGLCEKEAAEALKYQVKEIPFPARTYAAVRKTILMAEIQGFLGQAYSTILQSVGKMGARISGAPCGLYFTYDEQTGMSDMAAAFPVTGGRDLGEVKLIRVPGGKACLIDYVGPYDQSINAYNAFDLYFSKRGLKPKMPVIEEYITDPSKEPNPSKWLTKIYFPVE